MHLIRFLIINALCTLAACGAVPREPGKPQPKIPDGFNVDNFPFLDIFERTAIDPYFYLAKPESKFPQVSRCLPPHHSDPDTFDCNECFDKILDLGDIHGNFVISGGECRSITRGCCQVTVCAPKKVDLITPASEVQLALWKSAHTCVAQHTGSIFMDHGWDYLIMAGRPPKCLPAAQPVQERMSAFNGSSWE